MITKFKNYTQDQKILTLMILNIFMPFYVQVPILLILLVYVLSKRHLLQTIKEQPGYIFLYTWGFLAMVVALFYRNYLGAANAIGYICVGAFSAFYMKNSDEDYLKDMMDMMLKISILIAIIGMIEFWYFSSLKGYSFFEFKVQNSPKRRITGTFFNANYYAMMIEFFVSMCLYRWIQVKELKQKCFYVFIGILNIFMLYLTGCRAAFVPLAIVVPLFFILYGEKKWIFVSCGLMACAGLLVFIKPDLIPRLSDISTISSRMKIWKGAIEGIKMYPFFGNGPMTYGRLYLIYGWHKAPHCQNIYLDMISCYGMVGCVILLGYIKYVLKGIWNTRTNKALFALMVCFIVIFLVHGLVDCTLNYLSTSMTFLMVLCTVKRQENT